MVTDERVLRWEGTGNTRDLGGLPTADGRVTCHRVVVRSAHLDRLTPAGWAAMRAHGVRTIVDLRGAFEREALPLRGDADVRTIHLPLEDLSDTAFWDDHLSLCMTPRYYVPFLRHCPERAANVVAVIADSLGDGGVVVHCGIGRDRTGLVSLLLLGLVGVTPEVVAADHGMSAAEVGPLNIADGRDDDASALAAVYEELGSTPADEMRAAAQAVDAEEVLRAGGATSAQIDVLRSRLTART